MKNVFGCAFRDPHNPSGVPPAQNLHEKINKIIRKSSEMI